MRYTKTEAGQRALKDRSVPLTPRQRSAFILFDGKRTLAEVLSATSGLGVTMPDVDHLVELGLLAAEQDAAPVPQAAAVAAAPATTDASGLALPQQRYQNAYPIATRLTASLGLRGFRLNLAVEAAADYHQLEDLVPRIRAAVGEEKCLPLERALRGLTG
ncbi:hypothetical protein [Rhodoferax sediminis]|uniref:Uncharacterized protein n=1 Tax=Rhodoferax sediminis TaxID=2509614 RepID=A0A515D759_9BURK|nr:hypothetical protein [Rhodoferax sediminis]QDL36246.1 hypothetical protein EUB48_02235 [Rhodoferax sediminis]